MNKQKMPSLQPGLKKSLHLYFAAPEPAQDFAERLQADLLRRQSELLAGEALETSRGKPRRIIPLHNRRRRVLWMALLGLLALSGLAYTLLRLGGFIPGFGFTSGSQVYVLQESVKTSGGGLQVWLEQAVTDAEKLQVELSISGLPEEVYFLEALIQPAGAQQPLPAELGSSRQADGTTHLTYVFAALPAASRSAVLFLTIPEGVTLELPFNLRPLEPSEMVPLPAGDSGPQLSEVSQGVYLQLKNVAVNSGSSILQVSLETNAPHIQTAGP